MAYSNYTISAPVSFGDVNAALGTAHTDLGALCKDGNINPWARNKPFISTVLGVATDNDRRAAQFGMAKPILSSGQHFNKLASQCMFRTLSDTSNLKGYWEYRKPYGGSPSPYRLPDFNGYVHISNMPMMVTISGSGITSRGNHEYEMNFNTSPTFTLTFSQPATGHVPLWEFCQNAYNASLAKPWRVKIEVFSDNGSTAWYDRDTPEMSPVISDPIPFVANGFTNFSVDVTFNSTMTANTGKIYYVVVGLQMCDVSGNPAVSGMDNGYGFLPPYEKVDDTNQTWSFLWKIRLANYFGRDIKVNYGNKTLGYATSSWFTYTGGYFQADWSSGQLFLVCQISLNSVPMTFVGESGGGSGTRVQFAASCPTAHGETLYYATPANYSRQTLSTVSIGTGSSSSYQQLCMWIDGNIRPTSKGYYTINLMTRTYTGSSPSGTWVNATSLSIRLI